MNFKSVSLKTTGAFFLLALLIPQQLKSANPSLEETSLHQDALGELIVRRSSSGNVRAVFGAIRNPVSSKLIQTDPHEAAIAFFRYHADAFSVDSKTTFQPITSGQTTNGDLYVRFSQRYRGIQVLWRNAVVRYSDPSTIGHAIFDFDPSLDDISIVPTLNEEDVLAKAHRIIPNGTISKSAELIVYPSEIDPLLRRDVLAWKVSVSGNDQSGSFQSLMLVIDAHNGRLLEKINEIQEVNRKIYDAGDVSSAQYLPGNMLIRTETSDPSDDSEINLVFDRAGDSFNYFNTNFQWESFDGDDQDLVACARYDTNNAIYRSGEASLFNNVDLIAFSVNMATKDIVTHEFTHGVIDHTASLIYQDLSGAVNESFADVFGAFHDDANWTVGEGSSVGIRRDLSNPSNANEVCLGNVGEPCPDHIDETYCGGEDDGGVHHNSNILNHAAYEFAQVVGRDVAEDIYFDALESCLTENSGFTDTRDCVVQMAGSAHGTAAQEAFDDVGLTTSAEEPCNDDSGGDGGICAVSLYVSDESALDNDTKNNSYSVFEEESYILRNEVFADSELGEYYTDLYYTKSTAIVDVLLANNQLFLKGGVIILANLPGLLELTGSSDTTVILTLDSIGQIEGFLKEISRATEDSSLSSTIDEELERFDWDDLAGKTYTEAWDHLVENVDVP